MGGRARPGSGADPAASPSPDDEPFDALVARCEPLVRRAIRQVVGRHRDEDDLTQEVFLRLAIRLRQPGEIAVAPWLRRVARNVAIDELRRMRPEPVDDTVLVEAAPTGPDDASTMLEGAELGRIVHQAIGDLPDRQRLALMQRIDGSAGSGAGPLTADGELIGAEARDSLVARARRQLRRDLAERWRVAATVPGLAALRRLAPLHRLAGRGARVSSSRRRIGRWLPGASTPVGAKIAVLVVAGAVGTATGTWLAGGAPTGSGHPAGHGPAMSTPASARPVPVPSPGRPTSPGGPTSPGAGASGLPAAAPPSVTAVTAGTLATVGSSVGALAAPVAAVATGSGSAVAAVAGVAAGSGSAVAGVAGVVGAGVPGALPTATGAASGPVPGSGDAAIGATRGGPRTLVTGGGATP